MSLTRHQEIYRAAIFDIGVIDGESGKIFKVRMQGYEPLSFLLETIDGMPCLKAQDLSETATLHQQITAWKLLEHIFALDPTLKRLAFAPIDLIFAASPFAAYFTRKASQVFCERRVFYQLPWLWHRDAAYAASPERWTTSQGIAHPQRPEVAPGVLYKRYIPQLQKELAFELLDIGKHLEDFHAWHNQPRVAHFWDLNQDRAQLRAYLEKVHSDPHHIPVIGTVDGVAVGYFEIYWTAEDRLGPYYDADPFDRGFHMLIGNPDYLGGPFTLEFLRSLLHFLFLDEVRTRRIMAEPRFDNQKMLRYVDLYPVWKKLREFDFPHKRAALLEARREIYFEGDFI